MLGGRLDLLNRHGFLGQRGEDFIEQGSAILGAFGRRTVIGCCLPAMRI
ncbi:hypothetical protein [Streptomyces sp. WAC08241]|nr:hypothetical protein [Streptomyces sp. WAC08241]